MSYPDNILIKHAENSKLQAIMQKLGNNTWLNHISYMDNISYKSLAKLYAAANKISQKKVDIWRSRARVREFENILDLYSLQETSNKKYLDFGSGSSVLSSAIGEAFRFQTYATDIPIWHGEERKCEYKNVTFELLENGKIPFDEKFDVVSCLMVLHHISPELITQVICDIRAHMNSDGIFILREHDAQTETDIELIHIEHAIHCCVLENKKFEDFEREYRGYYMSSDFWIRHVTYSGFTLIGSLEAKGPTRYQYLIFRAA
jgi:2-polyprenyl-3-methyl-5-hydroxy-6-metoxy-1,4-benzoquinol methylase